MKRRYALITLALLAALAPVALAGPHNMTPMPGLQMVQWHSLKITVHDGTTSPAWSPVIQEVVASLRQWDVLAGLKYDRYTGSGWPSTGIYLHEPIPQPINNLTTYSPNANLYINFAEIKLISPDPPNYADISDLIPWATPHGRQVRTIMFEMMNALGFSESDHYTHIYRDPATGLVVNACAHGGGNMFLQPDRDLLKFRGY